MGSESEPSDLLSPASQTERGTRARVLKGGHLVFNHEFSSMDCVVRDLSETGARLCFAEPWSPPRQFELLVDVDGYKVDCETVWSKGRECGVHFTGPKVQTSKYRPQIDTNRAGPASDPSDSGTRSGTPADADQPEAAKPRAVMISVVIRHSASAFPENPEIRVPVRSNSAKRRGKGTDDGSSSGTSGRARF